jgi:NADH:ubiquinone oxidoreductase subunit 2 (subunit N)
MLSLAGLPPLPGFYAKYLVLQTIVDQSTNYSDLYYIIIIIATMITVSNYLRILYQVNYRSYIVKSEDNKMAATVNPTGALAPT